MQRLERRLEADDGDVRLRRIGRDGPPGAPHGARVDPDGVDAQRAARAGRFERQQPAVVLEQHERASLCLGSRSAERVRAHPRRRRIRVDERPLEQTESELLLHDPPHRLVESRLGDLAGVDRRDERRRILGPAELIDSGLHRLHEPLALRQLLDSPRHPDVGERRTLTRRRAGAALLIAVVGHAPVRDDDPAETVLASQHLGEELAVVARPDLLERPAAPRCALEDRVRRHHPADVRRERAEKRLHVIAQRRAGKRRESPVPVVRVQSLFRRAVADPVLHHGEHAPRVDAFTPVLKALDVRTHHAAREVGVLAERAVDAAPSRFGREVRLWRQRHLDPDGAILAPRDVAEPLRQRRVADRGEAERLRPLRELPRRRARAEHVLEVMARIGADRHGDAEPRLFGDLLEHVALRGQHRRRAAEPRDHVVHLHVLDQPPVRRRVVAGADARPAGLPGSARGAVHHRPRLLLERHPRHEVARPRGGRESPILVGIDLPIAIEVPEAIPALLDDRRAPRPERRL